MEVAAEMGIPPQSVAALDHDDLSTLVDVLNDRAKQREKRRG